jgi:hypothetical protein
MHVVRVHIALSTTTQLRRPEGATCSLLNGLFVDHVGACSRASALAYIYRTDSTTSFSRTALDNIDAQRPRTRSLRSGKSYLADAAAGRLPDYWKRGTAKLANQMLRSYQMPGFGDAVPSLRCSRVLWCLPNMIILREPVTSGSSLITA